MQRDINALIAFIESRHDTPHEWGRDKNDCVAFALAAAKAQTGKGRGSKVRWSSRASALKAIKQFGSLEKALDAHFVRIPPAQAHRGDIGGIPDETFGIHPMIVEGMTLVGPGDTGNRRLPRSAMTTAWSAVLPKPKR
jgi:hypothetical protein